ncbi:hypothetical protein HYE67_011276 [Fusarium culmorum]|uniref:Uncharacterized protein n=1 Tax=Fusarium culmorum TaxID=5516 RepID=A0A7S8DIG9_FUSCU|nr:hypothetical protein HYE67_011276 [Fusarium culmorum]
MEDPESNHIPSISDADPIEPSIVETDTAELITTAAEPAVVEATAAKPVVAEPAAAEPTVVETAPTTIETTPAEDITVASAEGIRRYAETDDSAISEILLEADNINDTDVTVSRDVAMEDPGLIHIAAADDDDNVAKATTRRPICDKLIMSGSGSGRI